MDEGTNFLSVKKGQIILILIFSLLFKANYEECVPPPSKKAREGEAAPSVPAPMQPGRKLKREWADNYNAEATQDREIAGPAAQEHSAAARPPSNTHYLVLRAPKPRRIMQM